MLWSDWLWFLQVGDGSERWLDMQQNTRFNLQTADALRYQARRDGGH